MVPHPDMTLYLQQRLACVCAEFRELVLHKSHIAEREVALLNNFCAEKRRHSVQVVRQVTAQQLQRRLGVKLGCAHECIVACAHHPPLCHGALDADAAGSTACAGVVRLQCQLVVLFLCAENHAMWKRDFSRSRVI